MSFSRDEIWESIAEDVSAGIDGETRFENGGFGTIFLRESRDGLTKVAFMVLRLRADRVDPTRIHQILRRTSEFTLVETFARCAEIMAAHS